MKKHIYYFKIVSYIFISEGVKIHIHLNITMFSSDINFTFKLIILLSEKRDFKDDVKFTVSKKPSNLQTDHYICKENFHVFSFKKQVIII